MIAHIERRGLLRRWYLVIRDAGELGPFWSQDVAWAVLGELHGVKGTAAAEFYAKGVRRGYDLGYDHGTRVGLKLGKLLTRQPRDHLGRYTAKR